MDKFTKTTEGELSNVNMVEEEAPQKGKAGKIVAIIISLLLAISAWLYVVGTDETIVEKKFDDIEVVILDKSEQFNIIADNVSVTLCGTNSQLVEIDPDKIVVKVNAISQRKGNDTRYYAYSNEIFYDGDDTVSVKEKTVKVLITLEEKVGK